MYTWTEGDQMGQMQFHPYKLFFDFLFQPTLLLHILFSIPVPSCGASYDSSAFYALGVGYLPVLGGYVLLEVPYGQVNFLKM